MRKKSLSILAVILICAAVVIALQSANYILNPSAPSPGGTKSSSTNYAGISSSGQASSGRMNSANYINVSGFISAFAGAGDVTPPSIGNLLFDGKEVVNNDYIAHDAEITATITDLGTGINASTSLVTVDSDLTYFDHLTGQSTFDVATGDLTVRLNLADGTHTVVIQAFDANNNSSNVNKVVKVDTGSARASSALFYPNPYDPSQGSARFAYQLNRDSNITLYLFNEINQLVWKRTYLAGNNGGRSGYNEIEWNGVSDFGRTVGNGAYFLRIVSGGKQIGKIKIAVLR